MKTVRIGLFALLTVSACDAAEGPVEGSGDAPAGKADVIDDTEEASDVYFAFSNGVFCFTAPCPSITVIGPDGERTAVAGIDLDETEEEAAAALLSGGIAVTGEILEGSWEPLAEGDVLVVDEVVGFAQEHLVVDKNLACFTAPCPTHDVYGDDGTHLPLAGVDVALDVFSSEDEAEIAGQIMDSEVTAIGWVRQGSWEPLGPGNVLHVSRIVAGVQNYEVRNNGVFCFTAPCPSLDAVDAQGEVVGLAGVNADPTNLPFEEQVEALEPLGGPGSIEVRGWISEGSWAPLGPGNMMHVLEFDPED